MLRFEPEPYATRRKQEWPDFTLAEPSTVFSIRPPLRKLVVVVDNEILTSLPDANFDRVSLLGGLLSHPFIEVYRFADDGPPRDVRRSESEVLGEFVPGWIVVGEPVPELGHLPVCWSGRDGAAVTRGGLIGNATEVAENDTGSSAYAALASSDAATRRRADAIAAQAASTARADLFITRRPYLHAVTWGLNRGVLVAAPEEALPLVSLYLRAQGAFVIFRTLDGTGTETFNRGLFYWVGTRELLPAGWRWFTACVQHGGHDDSLVYLGQSLFQRVQRALQARDAAHWALNRPPNNDTADDALSNLDLVLLGLMAAVDVTARVAHRTLGVDGSERGAGWQRKDWVTRVETVAPELAALVSAGTPGAHALTILSALRNSIHGAALDAMAVGSMTGRREDTLVGLPHGNADEVVAAMDALGGRDLFGVRELLPGRIYADPGALLDAIFARVLVLLDCLMRQTPVERLAGVLLTREDEAPPGDGVFEEWSRKSIRWQLDVAVPAA